ncbi:MAG: hypothetical protein K2X81_22700 [Candidatus Obscuribacterales bacterium]|nr:hypothetical protein [Candidatus Obscuribacterales bacterium]
MDKNGNEGGLEGQARNSESKEQDSRSKLVLDAFNSNGQRLNDSKPSTDDHSLKSILPGINLVGAERPVEGRKPNDKNSADNGSVSERTKGIVDALRHRDMIAFDKYMKGMTDAQVKAELSKAIDHANDQHSGQAMAVGLDQSGLHLYMADSRGAMIPVWDRAIDTQPATGNSDLISDNRRSEYLKNVWGDRKPKSDTDKEQLKDLNNLSTSELAIMNALKRHDGINLGDVFNSLNPAQLEKAMHNVLQFSNKWYGPGALTESISINPSGTRDLGITFAGVRLYSGPFKGD